MPRRTFQIGEVLTATNVNTFLMDQAVMTFADSTARSSAIATPVEGMLTYLESMGSYEYYDGAAFVALLPAGAGLVTSGSATYTFDASDAGSTYVFTAATATVTFSTATAFTAGDRVDIVRDSADSLTITAGSGVVFAGKDSLGTAISFTIDTRYEAASVLCVGSDQYRVIGAVTAV
jgi:hypothetical protein